MDEPIINSNTLTPKEVESLQAGDESKNKYMDQALHANDEVASGAKMTDLLNKDSGVYKDLNAPIPEPKPEVPEKPTKDAEGFPIIEQVHTYKEDLAGIIKEDQLSVSRIAMMQADANRDKEVKLKKDNPDYLQDKIYFIIATALLLIVIGLIGGALVISSKNTEVIEVPVIQKEKYIIFAEKQHTMDVSNSTKSEINAHLKVVASQFREEDSILEIIPTLGEGANAPKSSMIGFLNKVNTRAPENLTRTLSSKFFMGMYSKKGRTDPFLLMYSSSYDLAFPALLSWEGFMQDDLDWIFDTKPRSTAGATTTRLEFNDRVIANKDTRSFEDEDGRTAFFYSFIDQHTILFAKTSDTIRKVMDRLREAKFQ